MRNKIIAPLILLIVFALALQLLYFFKPQAEKKAPSRPASIPIEAIQVTRGSFNVSLPSQGIVQALQKSNLAAQVSGTVIEVSSSLRAGSQFAQGDTLLKIDDRDYVAALKLAEANLQKAEQAIAEEKARGVQAARDWERLGNGQPATPLALRVPQLATAKSELQAATAQRDSAKLNLERTTISAPYDGQVLNHFVDVGSFLNPGSQIASIVGNRYLEVALPVSAQWRHLIENNNAQVELSVSVGDNQYLWPAVVKRTAATIQPDSRQVALIAEVEPQQTPQDVPLLIGDYVEARIQGKTLSDVLVIPRNALSSGNSVWEVSQGKIYKRRVSLVWQESDVAVIDVGLNDGAVINITPVGNVVSGTLVTVMNELETNAPVSAGPLQ